MILAVDEERDDLLKEVARLYNLENVVNVFVKWHKLVGRNGSTSTTNGENLTAITRLIEGEKACGRD